MVGHIKVLPTSISVRIFRTDLSVREVRVGATFQSLSVDLLYQIAPTGPYGGGGSQSGARQLGAKVPRRRAPKSSPPRHRKAKTWKSPLSRTWSTALSTSLDSKSRPSQQNTHTTRVLRLPMYNPPLFLLRLLIPRD